MIIPNGTWTLGTERAVDFRWVFWSSKKMCGRQHLYNGTFVDAAEEERGRSRSLPSLQTGDGALVRGRISRGDNRHADSLGVSEILAAVLFLAFLNLVDVGEEVAKGSWVEWGDHVSRFVLPEVFQAAPLHDPFGLVVGEGLHRSRKRCAVHRCCRL